ncbi:unnamed protein product [Rangifer tarandus platyrhynchus]|uniref:Uncharacterized protein n=1 Tax=Rangifer tarandus platyrhynchus TaxID=3082113 RepID=A0AC59YBE6_RANTA
MLDLQADTGQSSQTPQISSGRQAVEMTETPMGLSLMQQQGRGRGAWGGDVVIGSSSQAFPRSHSGQTASQRNAIHDLTGPGKNTLQVGGFLEPQAALGFPEEQSALRMESLPAASDQHRYAAEPQPGSPESCLGTGGGSIGGITEFAAETFELHPRPVGASPHTPPMIGVHL